MAKAQANMDADLDLVARYSGNILLRHYRWPSPGITLPKKKLLPAHLAAYDVGIRSTGGGILFHAPGDFLFSLVAPNHDSHFPKPLSQKMKLVSHAMHTTLDSISVTVAPDTESERIERDYCHTYPNPFELRYKGDKVCALALRRFRHVFLIQGLLHLRSNIHAFPMLDAYTPYFSKGLHLSPQTEQVLITTFLQNLSDLFNLSYTNSP